MKLRNKKTGEIVEICTVCPEPFEARDFSCNSLAELNAEWEDYEEPKEYWFIDYDGRIIPFTKMKDTSIDKSMKQIGNYFETKEEAEQAVEKLKAWKRLEDKGFRLNAVVDTFFCLDIYMRGESYETIKDDLKIVFGDETTNEK